MYARGVAAAAMLLLVLFASLRLYILIQAGAETGSFKVIGMTVPYSAVWAAGLFVVLGAFVFLFTFGLATGLKVLDENTHRFVDLLVDTESELAKVAWPGRDELGRSTGAVLVLILVLGAFLYIVDQIVAYVFGLLRVLPQ